MMKRIYTVISSLLVLCTIAAGQESRTLTLLECREMALKYNEDLQKAGISVEQAAKDKAVAFKAYLPKIDASADALYMSDIEAMGYDIVMKGAWLAGLQLSQPVYAGGQIITGNKLAKVGEEVSKEQLRQTRMKLIADVDKAYWTLVSVGKKVEMLDSYIEQLDAVYKTVQTSIDNALATKSDLLRVEASRSDLIYQKQKAENGLVLCKMNLCSTIGLPLDTDVVPGDDEIIVTPVGTLDENIDNRPEVKMLSLAVDAQKLQVRMAKAAYLPTLGVGVTYNRYGNVKMKGTTQLQDGSTYNFTQKFSGGKPMAIVQLSIPIFDWGSNKNKIDKARLEVKKAELDLQKNTRLMSIETKQASQNLLTSESMIRTAEIGLEQAKENLRVMTEKYNNSLATLTDLLEAQSSWRQAVSNDIEARTQYKIYQTEYLRTTGNLE